MNTNFFRLIIVITLAVLSTTGCLKTFAQRPAGYVPDQMGVPHPYIIPPGRTVGEQLKWIEREEYAKCSDSASRVDTITGVVVGATLGAVLAGRGSRATGAVLGGLGGGALSSMSIGEYCAMLQTTRGLIMQKIADDSPRSSCRHYQVEENGRRYTRTDCASTTGVTRGYKAYPNR